MMDGSLITHSPPQVRLGPPQPRKTEPEHEENPLAISFASTLLHIAKAFSYPPRKQHVVFGFHRAVVVTKTSGRAEEQVLHGAGKKASSPGRVVLSKSYVIQFRNSRKPL